MNNALPAKVDSLSQFESMMADAKATTNFTPLWRSFVRTNFLVGIVRAENSLPNRVELLSVPVEAGGTDILIAEFKENLPDQAGADLMAMSGAEIVRRVPDGVGISIALSDSFFDISAGRVAWLKKSLAASQEALKKKADAANDLPTHLVATEEGATMTEMVQAPAIHTSTVNFDAPAVSDSTASPDSFQYQEFEMQAVPVETNKKPPFNAASIRRKHVTHAGLGIEMMMPEHWQEVRNDKALKLFETRSDITVEINGRRRDDMSLENWMDARLTLVTQQLPALKSVGGKHDLRSATWPASMRAQFCEFSGCINGDEQASHYLICCFETEKRLLVVCMLAKQAVFESQRALLIWMLENVGSFELRSTQKSDTTLSAPLRDTVSETHSAPSIFSLSFSGRIGRARLLVYSLLWVLPFSAFALIGMLGVKVLKLGDGVFAAVVMVLAVLMQIRPYILRLHDLNLGGKYVFIYFILLFLPSLAPKSGLVFLTLLVAVAGLSVLFFFPGSSEENDYGPPNPPNSIGMKLGAVLCGVFMIAGGVNYYKAMRGHSAAWFGKGAVSNATGIAYSPADKSFVIDFPISSIEAH